MARKFLATRAAAHRENMLSEGLSFLLLSVRPSTEAGLGVAAHMQSVRKFMSGQIDLTGLLWGNCPRPSLCVQKTFKGRDGWRCMKVRARARARACLLLASLRVPAGCHPL
jgi:hypothetical protein